MKDYEFEHKGTQYINYIKILMLFSTLDEEKESLSKAETVAQVVKSWLEERRMSVEKMLKGGRESGRLTLGGLEGWAKKNLLSEIFFDDLEIVWDYWGNPEYLSEKEFKEILEKNGKSKNVPYKRNVEREGEKDKDKEKMGREREERYEDEYGKAKALSKFHLERQRELLR